MSKSVRVFGLALMTFAFSACDGGKEAALLAKVNEATSKGLACEKKSTELKEEIANLKHQLAQAMANPAPIRITDPEIIELVAKVKAERAAKAAAEPVDPEERLGKGDLDPREAGKIILAGAKAFQVCYEKALRKNSGLQYRQGLPVNVALTIRPSGKVQGVDVKPSVDGEMTECMKTAAIRWKFPPFGGQPVTLEQQFKLKPQT